MGVAPSERKEARAVSIAAAVRHARERRGLTLRDTAARCGIAASTLSRLEDPERADSPQVDTLETLAATLECPLYELLGETQTIEYRGLGAWPEALNGFLVERSGFVTPGERAFVESHLALLPEEDPFTTGSATFWESLLSGYRESPLWRTIDALVAEGWRLDGGAQAGLRAVVLSLIQGAHAEWPNKLRTVDYGPVSPAVPAKRAGTKKSKKTRGKPAKAKD